MTVRSLISVHRPRYFRFCNVLHIWTIRAIPTYRVYRLYDSTCLYMHVDCIMPGKCLTGKYIYTKCTCADFPDPIKESIQVLRNHVYIPLSDVQIAQEEELERKRCVCVCVCLCVCVHVHVHHRLF